MLASLRISIQRSPGDTVLLMQVVIGMPHECPGSHSPQQAGGSPARPRGCAAPGRSRCAWAHAGRAAPQRCPPLGPPAQGRAGARAAGAAPAGRRSTCPAQWCAEVSCVRLHEKSLTKMDLFAYETPLQDVVSSADPRRAPAPKSPASSVQGASAGYCSEARVRCCRKPAESRACQVGKRRSNSAVTDARLASAS